jgi:hypothetical protein
MTACLAEGLIHRTKIRRARFDRVEALGDELRRFAEDAKAARA